MILRELYEANGKTAVIAFGRMNPPTIGHKKLVDKIEGMPGDHFVFVSHTQDAKKNPLSFDEKVRFAKASFGSTVTVGNEGVKTIIQAMQKIESLGYTDVIYVAGSDRVAQFEKLLNDYNGKEYTFQSIKIENAGERDPDADGAEGMSASKMRSSAVEGNFDEFKQGVANPSIAQEMYDTIRKNMGIKQEEVKEEPVTEYVQAIGPIVAGLKYGKYALKIIKWIYRNKWSIAFFTAGWKTVKWISDALAWLDKYLNHPIVQALVRVAGPAIIVAVALYGGRKLYLQLVEMDRAKLSTEEMRQRLLVFKHDPSELAGFEKELEAEKSERVENFAESITESPQSQADGEIKRDKAASLSRGEVKAQRKSTRAKQRVANKKVAKDTTQEDIQTELMSLLLADEDVNELNIFKSKIDNSSVKEQDPNKLKVLDWISARNDGKEHFLSFYRPGAAFSGNVIWIRPDAAKQFMRTWDNNEEHQDRMKKALTSVQTTSKLFANLKVKHDIRRAK